MQAKIAKWGNGLGVRIPRELARRTNIEAGTEVELDECEGNLIVRPLKRKHYPLGELLGGIDKTQFHAETDWGKPEGREIS